MAATLRLCERAIVTNDFLADRLRAAAPGKDVSVIRNFLNREQLDVSLRLYDAKVRSGFARDRNVHLGYFSGTPTHAKDFAVVTDALAGLLRRDPRVMLRLVGFMQPDRELAEFRDRIETFPLQDFLNLQRLIASVEINLAPLQDNDFTNCKSELKYFEAAIVGTVTLASPTHAFCSAIDDGRNGHLVPSYAWRSRIEAAIGRLDDPGMAERAFRHAQAQYSPATMVPAIRRALLPHRPDGAVARLPGVSGAR
jgi:glycosyltransferase involved in cell wall biosynthesis